MNGVLLLTEEQDRIESVRVASGIWNDVLYVLRDAAHQLRAIGESRQAEATRIDAESMERRAHMHLHNMTVREQARISAASDALQAYLDVEPANDNQQGNEGHEGHEGAA